MTKKEARNLLNNSRPKGNNAYSIMLNESLDMAIEALKQEDILDKIREEIEQIEINGHIRDVECFSAGINAALKIIDKHNTRKEVKKMSQDVDMIVTCNHENCPYNHEKECGKDVLFMDDLECIAQAESEAENDD